MTQLVALEGGGVGQRRRAAAHRRDERRQRLGHRVVGQHAGAAADRLGLAVVSRSRLAAKERAKPPEATDAAPTGAAAEARP